VVGYGELITVLAIAELELALEVVAPQIVGGDAWRQRRALSAMARSANTFDQPVRLLQRSPALHHRRLRVMRTASRTQAKAWSQTGWGDSIFTLKSAVLRTAQMSMARTCSGPDSEGCQQRGYQRALGHITDDEVGQWSVQIHRHLVRSQ
jgi:hypothetical protein